MRYPRLKKRAFTMLEVLLAAMLVILCLLPLMVPHIQLIKAQSKFNRKVELDHQVNLLYAAILEKLYRNEIPWENLKQGQYPLSALVPSLSGQIYRDATYEFAMPNSRPVKYKKKPYSVHLVTLTFHFISDKTPLDYTYKIFVVRDSSEVLGAAAQQAGTPKDKEADAKAKNNSKKTQSTGSKP